MATLTVVNMKGESVGSMEVKDSLVALEAVNLNAVRQCVDAHLANRRQGTHKTKERGEMRGGGRKPWRQKGTGRARAGSTRSPIWRGGAVTFGPRPRSYRQKVNRKVRRLAMRSVLTDKLQSERLLVIDEFATPGGRTKEFLDVLGALNLPGKALFVTDKADPLAFRAARNCRGAALQVADSMSVYELLSHEYVVVTKAAIERMEALWG